MQRKTRRKFFDTLKIPQYQLTWFQTDLQYRNVEFVLHAFSTKCRDGRSKLGNDDRTNYNNVLFCVQNDITPPIRLKKV